MATYLIWNPYVADTAPPTVDLFLTCGEMRQVHQGSDDFVQAILEDLGVDDAVTEWTLTRWRCGYFSEPDTERWEDRWPEVWQLRTTLSDVPWLDDVPIQGYVETEAMDSVPFRLVLAHPPYGPKVTHSSTPCLVLADFLNADNLEKARAEVAALVPDAGISVGQGLAQAPQLRIDLGDRPNAFYEEGAGAALEVEAVCESHGGTVWAQDSLIRAVG